MKTRAKQRIFSVLLIACSSLLPGAGGASDAGIEGWKYVANDARGFRLYIPPGWDPLDTDAEKFRYAVEEWGQPPESVAARKADVVDGAEPSRSVEVDFAYSFAAADTSERSARDGFLENVTVITVPGHQAMDSLSIDILEDYARKSFPWDGEPVAGLFKVGHTRLFQYGGRVSGSLSGGNPLPFHIQAYVIPHGGLTHILTITSGPDRAEEMQGIGLTILKHMELMTLARSSEIVWDEQQTNWTIKPAESGTNYQNNVYGSPTSPSTQPYQYTPPTTPTLSSWEYGARQSAWDQRNRRTWP